MILVNSRADGAKNCTSIAPNAKLKNTMAALIRSTVMANAGTARATMRMISCEIDILPSS
jgi:hypothetical protein